VLVTIVNGASPNNLAFRAVAAVISQTEKDIGSSDSWRVGCFANAAAAAARVHVAYTE